MCRSWYFPVEEWIIDPDVHGLLDGRSDVMCLSAYNGEAVHTDRMCHCLAVLIGGRGGSEVFIESIPKDPSQFPDIFLLTLHLGAFVHTDYPPR